MTLPPPDPSSSGPTDLPDPTASATEPVVAEPRAHRGLNRRLALPLWGWLLGGAAVAGLIVALVLTRPTDDTDVVAALNAELAAQDAELLQAQADAQQEAFDDVQEVRDEVERQLSDAASAREQAEQANELATGKYTDVVAFEITRVQAEAVSQACTSADAAGYAQAGKPDATTFGPAAAAGLPADASMQVLVALDQTAIQAKVDECYQTGSDRYMSQTTTTTTTTVPVEVPVADPSVVPVDQTPS